MLFTYCWKRLMAADSISSRLMSCNSPYRQPIHSSSSSSSSSSSQQLHRLPPIKKHKRQVTRLEHAAAIGLQALQAAQRAVRVPTNAVNNSAAGGSSTSSGNGLPATVSQLLPNRPARKKVGVLQQLPVIPPADELAASALKRSLRVTPGAGIKNEAEKERSRAAKQLDTHMKELSVPLTRFLKAFPAPAALHPFDAALLDLTVGTATYSSVLGKVDSLRKALQETGKGFANRASNAANKKAATAVAEEGSTALAAVFDKGAKAVEDLKKLSRSLRSLPYVDPSLPTLALVGAPNVGKSSLVRVLSSGAPEVCNYPFTTRSIKMGHFYIDARRHQVTDTPGLLLRPDEYRNKMELLTLAALQYLPSSVMFVADLTEECGTSVNDQWLIRQELRDRFPNKPWVDVLSKADLLESVWQQVDQQEQHQAAQHSNNHTLVQQQQQHQQQGEEEAERKRLQSGCDEDVMQQQHHLDWQHGSVAEVDQGTELNAETLLSASVVQTAEQFAAALPDAVRVSAVTEVGLSQLQQALVYMLQSPEAASEAAVGAEMLKGSEEDSGMLLLPKA